MKHLIFLVYMISFFSGIVNIIIAEFIYLKEERYWINTYIRFMGAVTILVLAQTVTSYNLVNIVNSITITVLLNVFSYGAAAIMIYEMPKLIYEFIEKEWLHKKLFRTLAVLQAVYLMLYYFTSYKAQIKFIASGNLFGVLLFSIVLLIKHYKEKKNLVFQKDIRYFIIVTIMCLPYMYLDTKTEQIVLLKKYFPYGLLSLPIYYLICNLLCIYIEMKYIRLILHSEEKVEKKEQTKSEPINECEVFYNKYHITNREQEIMRLLIEGKSYTEIAEQLTISVTTVKTHVHHIYQKTGTKNKIQLIQLAKDD